LLTSLLPISTSRRDYPVPQLPTESSDFDLENLNPFYSAPAPQQIKTEESALGPDQSRAQIDDPRFQYSQIDRLPSGRSSGSKSPLSAVDPFRPLPNARKSSLSPPPKKFLAGSDFQNVFQSTSGES
jgi:hypothetical protein